MGQERTRMSLRDFKKMSQDEKNALLSQVESCLMARLSRNGKLEDLELEVRDYLGIAVSIVKEVTSLRKFRDKLEQRRL